MYTTVPGLEVVEVAARTPFEVFDPVRGESPGVRGSEFKVV
jgi:hypothetical protein